MQLKSTRGVQQEEVWAAADQLVGDGLRPTIERVRLKMGRGSPNTVSPMLDAWFSSLGARLGIGAEAQHLADDLPVAVRQCANKLWETAAAAARELANQQLLTAQRAVDELRVSLELRERDLAQRQQSLQERQSAQDELIELTRSQVTDLSSRLAQAILVSRQRDAEIEALQQKLAYQEVQRLADQRRIDEQLQHHAQERGKLQESATLTERRLMTELDRERQESKRLKSKLEQSQVQAETTGNQFRAQLQTLGQKLLDVEQELRSERQAAMVAQQRASELRGLLDEQAKTNVAALAQLNQLLTVAVPQAQVPPKFRRLLKVKPGQPRSSS